LLTFDHDPLTREPTVEVAHEALLQEWQRLREWLDESRADIRMQRVLGNAAEEWQAAGSDPGFLLRGSRLDQFEAWAEITDLAQTQSEQDFLAASLEERREREAIETERREHEAVLERRSRNFLRALVGVLAVAVVMAVILSGIAFNQRGIAQNSEATATFAQGQALNEAATAVAAQLEAKNMAAAEVQARKEAEKARRFSTANELVAFAKNELENPSDVSYSLALLLAKEAVMTTLLVGESVTPGAEEVLRQVIDVAPIQRIIFEGHTGSVNFASWSPDGMLIVTASDDGTARIWDAHSGEELRVLSGHSGGVNHATWSPDGKQILTAGDDHSVRIWDVDSGEEVKTFEGNDLGVRTANWSADGSQILSASGDVIILWDAQTGEQLFQKLLSAAGLDPLVSQIVRNYGQFNPTGDQIATKYGNAVIIVNSHTGEEINRRGSQAGVSNSADWSGDGNWLLTAHDLNSAIIWDIQTGGLIKELRHTASVEHASWKHDESQVATVTQNGIVHIWEPQSGRILHKWQANFSPLWSVEWSPDGERILTAGGDGVARIWEIGTPGQGKPIEHPGLLSTASWSPDGRFILSASAWMAYIWDVASSQEVIRFRDHFSQVNAAAWESNGERVISGDANGTAIIWDANTGEQLHKMQGHTQAINTVAWSPDGRWAITGSLDRTARIWDTESGEQVNSLRGHSGSVLSASWSPDNKLIITTSADNTAVIWQADSGEELFRLQGHDGSVNDADWSPDGNLVVTASGDRTVRFWDVRNGQEIDQLIGHNGAVLSVEWEPGGINIVTAGEDRTARIWDATTGEEVGKISGHDAAITEVRWSPDGSQILTASADRTIRIWPVGIEGLLSLADSLILREPPELTPGERCIYLHECGE
jgi:WD40 repeat protein